MTQPLSLGDVFVQTAKDLERLAPVIHATIPRLNGTHTYDDLVGMILHGRVKFWALENSFALTEVVEYPRLKCYHIFLAGGRLDEFVKATPQVVAEAKRLGCTRLTQTGRKGFERALRSAGWEITHTTMSLEI